MLLGGLFGLWALPMAVDGRVSVDVNDEIIMNYCVVHGWFACKVLYDMVYPSTALGARRFFTLLFHSFTPPTPQA